jgi:hypothetical protein
MDTQSPDLDLVPPHEHRWQPIPNWYARYRCTICSVVGCKPRVVTALVDGGAYGSPHVTPYVCGATRGGVKCGNPAQAKKKGGVWRCREHLLTSATSSARSALAQKKSSATPRALSPKWDGEGVTDSSAHATDEKIDAPPSWNSPAGG